MYAKIEKMTVCDGSGDFVYYGIQNQLQKSVKVHLHDTDMLELVFNVDGISPFKSNPVIMWPILCKLIDGKYFVLSLAQLYIAWFLLITHKIYFIYSLNH